MNPIVVICTHNRLEITSYNIRSLLKQSVIPKIVLVVSNQEERIYYMKQFPQIHLCIFPNVPLGAKWQHGVNAAYELRADPLIILGSDDILGPDFIKICCESDYPFIGLWHWYIHHKGRTYYCEYLPKQPLGGGRTYSYELLRRLDGKIFSTKINRHLDDYAVVKTASQGIEAHEDLRLQVHAVKGDWPVLNPVNLTHPNIKVISEHDSKEFFNDLP